MFKKILKIAIVVIAILFVLAAACFTYYKLCMDPYRGTVEEIEPSLSLNETLSAEEVREDIEYMMECLRDHHPAWLDGSGRDVPVETGYESEVNAIEEELSVLELYRISSKIISQLHDGHSYVRWQNEELERYIDDFSPLKKYGTPTAVNGIPVSELISIYKERASYEVDAYAEELFFNNVLISESQLRLCGVDTSDGVVFSFEDDDISLDFVPLWAVEGNNSNSADDEWVYYEIDENNSLGIFTLRSCRYNDQYLSVLDNFFKEVFERSINNIVVDLRGNGGGNSMVANKFIEYLNVDSYQSWDSALRFDWYLLKNEDIVCANNKQGQVFDGEIFVLTDTLTYSAAMDFAMLIGDNDMGTIVGQPSGNMPDAYGDCLFFQMPNSKLMISVSYKKWSRIDNEKSGQPLIPDVEVASEDALNKVYELIDASN